MFAVRGRGMLSEVDALRGMLFIRRFEEACLSLSQDGEIQGSIHLCLGQEAIPVGAMSVLGGRDRVISTYRGHGWALACGSDPVALMAEIAQRADGLNGGRCGSPLLSDPSVGFLGENSIVGAGAPIGAGAALAAVASGSGAVVLVSLGDGAMNQGSVTEAMVFAASRSLPVIFLCENNGWSEMTPIAWTSRGELIERGRGLGIESHVVDGDDVFAVAAAVASAADTCRQLMGPVFLECRTHRLGGHYNRDVEHYRPAEDAARARANDPIARLTESLLASGTITEESRVAMDSEVLSEVQHISAQVRDMPAPPPDSAWGHLYCDELSSSQMTAVEIQPPKEMTYQRAINAALRQSLSARKEVILYGEDVGFAGGIFGVSRGLQKEFGSDRVFDTPIAEAAILGSAVGAAIEGLRPVVEIMWADFVFVALDQIVNQAANIRYVNRSKQSAPLTIRMQQGVTPGACAQHSQSIEAILAHIPGIKVGLPATPQDAYAMTLAAIEDEDPTVLIEFRSLYQLAGEVILGGVLERAGGARRYGSGADLAIITWGSMLHTSLEAAAQLQGEGMDVSVLDLRWLSPLDDEAIDSIVRQCHGRVIVAHEANRTAGFGAEVAARIFERHFGYLEAPVSRVAAPDTRMPSAPNLQRELIPDAEMITEAAHELLATASGRRNGS